MCRAVIVTISPALFLSWDPALRIICRIRCGCYSRNIVSALTQKARLFVDIYLHPCKKHASLLTFICTYAKSTPFCWHLSALMQKARLFVDIYLHLCKSTPFYWHLSALMQKARLFVDIYLHLCKKHAFLLTFICTYAKARLFIDIYLHLCKKQAFLLTFICTYAKSKPFYWHLLTLLCSPDDSADHVYVNTGDNDSIAGVSSDAESHKRASASNGTKSTKHNQETETSRM